MAKTASQILADQYRKEGLKTSSIGGTGKVKSSSAYVVNNGYTLGKTVDKNPSTGRASTPSSAGYVAEPQENAYERYLQRMLDEQNKANEAAVNASIENVAAQRDVINRGADTAAQQAYINREIASRDMPQQLSALGVTGGGSESALLGLNAGYENSRNLIQQQRDQALTDNTTQQNQIRAQGAANAATNEANYLNQMANYQFQQEQNAYQNALKAQSTAAANAKQDQINQVRQSALNRMMNSGNPGAWLTQYSDSLDPDTYSWLVNQYATGNKAGLYGTDNSMVSSAFSSMINSGNPQQWLSRYGGNLSSDQLNSLLSMYRTFNGSIQ